MLTVETIGRIRREHFIKGKNIREIARDLKVSEISSLISVAIGRSGSRTGGIRRAMARGYRKRDRRESLADHDGARHNILRVNKSQQKPIPYTATEFRAFHCFV